LMGGGEVHEMDGEGGEGGEGGGRGRLACA